jgi:hypothetical protein
MAANSLPNLFIPDTRTAKGGGSDKIDAAVVRAFKRVGFDHVTPTNVMTFNRWVSEGYRPREGEKSVKVKRWRLFHKSQLRPLTKAEIEARDEKAGIKPETATHHHRRRKQRPGR